MGSRVLCLIIPLPDYRVNQRKNYYLICAYTVCQHTGCIQISSPTTKNSPGISAPCHHHHLARPLFSFHLFCVFFFCFFSEDFKPLFSHTHTQSHIESERRASSGSPCFCGQKKMISLFNYANGRGAPRSKKPLTCGR